MYVTGDLQEKIKHGSDMFHIQIYDNKPISPIMELYTHWHKEIELIKVISGSFMLIINGVEYVTKPGDCFIINKSDLHQAYALEQKESLHYAIVFDLNMLKGPEFDVCQHKYLDPILKGDLRFPTYITTEHTLWPKINHQLESIRTLFKDEPYGYELAVKSNLTQLLVTLLMNNALDVVHQYQSETHSSKLEFVKLGIEYIHSNYKEKILISDVAEQINISVEYFCRLFKQYTGKTPIEYLNNYRIEQAANQIISTNQSITEIAFDCGFDNTSYFIRKFKHQKSLTPKQFRLKYVNFEQDEI